MTDDRVGFRDGGPWVLLSWKGGPHLPPFAECFALSSCSPSVGWKQWGHQSLFLSLMYDRHCVSMLHITVHICISWWVNLSSCCMHKLSSTTLEYSSHITTWPAVFEVSNRFLWHCKWNSCHFIMKLGIWNWIFLWMCTVMEIESVHPSKCVFPLEVDGVFPGCSCLSG